jgi:ATP-dependent exoDNAse (exonuclease V) beta subunit
MVETVREITGEGGPLLSLAVEAGTVSMVTVDGAVGDRPGGMAFGLLVHVMLALAPFDATRPALQAIATIEARSLGVRDGEAVAAVDVVERVLKHELLARARTAWARGACRRETPVTLTAPDGTLVEGIVDLAFEENGAWTVVDYKTDRELAVAGEERYRRQVALYASAIAQATGQAASGVLMRV